MKPQTSFLKRAAISMLAAGATVLSAGAFAKDLNAKPSNWPSQYTWYEYDNTTVKTKSNGPAVTYQQGIKGLTGVRFSTLPLEHAIVRVRGDGSRKLALLLDPMCPHSRSAEKDYNQLDNVTIYTFILPTLNKSPNSKNSEMTKRILCAPTNKERAQLVDNWFVAGIEPPEVVGCDTATDEVFNALKHMRDGNGDRFVDVSPSVFFDRADLAKIGALPGKLVDAALNEAAQKEIAR